MTGDTEDRVDDLEARVEELEETLHDTRRTLTQSLNEISTRVGSLEARVEVSDANVESEMSPIERFIVWGEDGVGFTPTKSARIARIIAEHFEDWAVNDGIPLTEGRLRGYVSSITGEEYQWTEVEDRAVAKLVELSNGKFCVKEDSVWEGDDYDSRRVLTLRDDCDIMTSEVDVRRVMG